MGAPGGPETIRREPSGRACARISPATPSSKGLALTPGFDRVACVQLVLAEQDPVDL